MTSSFSRIVVAIAVNTIVAVFACDASAQPLSRPSDGPQHGPASGPASGPAAAPHTADGHSLDERTAVITARFKTPAGFERVATTGFGAWLRRRLILPESTPVRRFDGEKAAAPWSKGVVDVGFIEGKDLQQCADSALRLYAEYVRAEGKASALSFHATNGDVIPFERYEKGERVVASGNHLTWLTSSPSRLEAPFEARWKSWLEDVFMYAGSMSLRLDTTAVTTSLRPGDLLVLPGSPGHVIVVMDVAEDAAGRQQLLLGQGFMPAQTFHMLGWFAPATDGSVTVPSWPKPFDTKSRRRFK